MKNHLDLFELMRWSQSKGINILLEHDEEGIHVDVCDYEGNLPVWQADFEYGDEEIEKILCEMVTDMFTEMSEKGYIK